MRRQKFTFVRLVFTIDAIIIYPVSKIADQTRQLPPAAFASLSCRRITMPITEAFSPTPSARTLVTPEPIGQLRLRSWNTVCRELSGEATLPPTYDAAPCCPGCARLSRG